MGVRRRWAALGGYIHSTTCERDGQREAALQHRELSPMLCDDLGGEGGVGGRLKRERVHAYITWIHAVVRQKLRQHCKAVIRQLKFKRK